MSDDSSNGTGAQVALEKELAWKLEQAKEKFEVMMQWFEGLDDKLHGDIVAAVNLGVMIRDMEHQIEKIAAERQAEELRKARRAAKRRAA